MSITKKARLQAARERARIEMQGDLEKVQQAKSKLGSPPPKKSTTTTATTAATATSASKVRSSPAVMKSPTPTTTPPSKSKKEALRERARLAMEEDKMMVEENLKSPNSAYSHVPYVERIPTTTTTTTRSYSHVATAATTTTPDRRSHVHQMQQSAVVAPTKVPKKKKSSSSCVSFVIKTLLFWLAVGFIGVFMTSTHSFGGNSKLLSSSQATEMIHWETSRSDQVAISFLWGITKGTIYIAVATLATIVKFVISSPVSSILGISVAVIVNKLNKRNKGRNGGVDAGVGGDDFYDANDEY